MNMKELTKYGVAFRKESVPNQDDFIGVQFIELIEDAPGGYVLLAYTAEEQFKQLSDKLLSCGYDYVGVLDGVYNSDEAREEAKISVLSRLNPSLIIRQARPNRHVKLSEVT